MGCGYDVGMLGLFGYVSAANSFCICTKDVMCHWFGEGVGVVSDDRGFRCEWGCCSARIGTFGAIGLYITSGKGCIRPILLSLPNVWFLCSAVLLCWRRRCRVLLLVYLRLSGIGVVARGGRYLIRLRLSFFGKCCELLA